MSIVIVFILSNNKVFLVSICILKRSHSHRIMLIVLNSYLWNSWSGWRIPFYSTNSIIGRCYWVTYFNSNKFAGYLQEEKAIIMIIKINLRWLTWWFIISLCHPGEWMLNHLRSLTLYPLVRRLINWVIKLNLRQIYINLICSLGVVPSYSKQAPIKTSNSCYSKPRIIVRIHYIVNNGDLFIVLKYCLSRKVNDLTPSLKQLLFRWSACWISSLNLSRCLII